MQTRTQSVIETLSGTAIGFIIALSAQVFITNLYGIPTTFQQDTWITVFFTGVSILRGYGVRRFFNWLWHTRYAVTSEWYERSVPTRDWVGCNHNCNQGRSCDCATRNPVAK